MNHAEFIAKQIVPKFYQGCQMRFRDDQSHGEYDFDLSRGKTNIAAVEVTMLTDQEMLNTRASIDKGKKRPVHSCAKV